MSEYGYKELSELLHVSEPTVKRWVKKLNLEGTLIDRPGGGTKRIFDEAAVERLKQAIRPDLPAVREESGGRSMIDRVDRPEALVERFTAALVERDQTHAEELRQRDQVYAEALAELATEIRLTNTQLRQELTERREELRQLQRENRAIREELKAIREEQTRPWWERLWRRRDPEQGT